MSKYFDQTFKTGDVGTDPEKLQITGIDKFLETVSSFKNSAPGLAASGDLGESRLGQCRKMKIPAVGKLLGQFGGGPALEAAEESYRALRTRLLRARSAQGLRSVVVTSATPGEGKTLTSLNLSLCCAQLHDLRVLLIDADIRTSGLSRTLGFHPSDRYTESLCARQRFAHNTARRALRDQPLAGIHQLVQRIVQTRADRLAAGVEPDRRRADCGRVRRRSDGGPRATREARSSAEVRGADRSQETP